MTPHQHKREFDIPQVSTYDPASLNYVNDLELGIASIREENQASLRRNLEAAVESSREVLLSLNKVDGIEVRPSTPDAPPDPIRRIIRLSFGEVLGETPTFDIIIDPELTPEDERRMERAVEDRTLAHEYRTTEVLLEIKERDLHLRRANEDHWRALYETVKTTPVVDPNPTRMTQAFYISVREGEETVVYEAYVDRKSGVITGPRKNPHIRPTFFEGDHHDLREYRAQCKATGTNAYFIANPTTLVTVGQAFEMALEEVRRNTEEQYRKECERPAENPGNSLNDAIRHFEHLRERIRL